jgi:hypothetical protein
VVSGNGVEQEFGIVSKYIVDGEPSRLTKLALPKAKFLGDCQGENTAPGPASSFSQKRWHKSGEAWMTPALVVVKIVLHNLIRAEMAEGWFEMVVYCFSFLAVTTSNDILWPPHDTFIKYQQISVRTEPGHPILTKVELNLPLWNTDL